MMFNQRYGIDYDVDMKHWSTISDNWDNVIHYPVNPGRALTEYSFDTILDAITNSI